MDVSGISYNGNMQEWKPIEPLQNAGSQDLLTGVHLTTGQRLDRLEITSEKSELPASAAKIDNDQSLKVVHITWDHYLRSTDQYLGVFEQYARGTLSEDDFIAYSVAFGHTVGSTLETDTKTVAGLNALVEEMKENISKGIVNTPDNLKTELAVGGMKLTWKELMNLQKTGEYIDKFCGTSPCGYDGYAKIGIARAYIYKPGLGLTDEQIKVLSEAVEKKIAKKLENTKSALEDAVADIQNPMWEGYYIGGTSTMPIASNTKIISEITDIFSKIDPNDQSSFDAAVDRFQELMRPWEQTFASYIARQSPGYASSYVQEKERNSRASYQSIWNGSYS